MARASYVYGGQNTIGTYTINRERYTSVVDTAYGLRRYFSSIDTEVYFGERIIDDMVAFDFIINENKMPLFGYNNFTAQRMITGQKTIQGSFAINFTQTFDLVRLLESDEIAESLYHNVYEDIIQSACPDNNNPLFKKSFDITLSYGEGKGQGSYASCFQTLVGCQITSYRQAFDTSGEPILDMYTFIAKDLIQNSTVEISNEVLDSYLYENEYDKEPDTRTPIRFAYKGTDEENTLRRTCEKNKELLGVLFQPEFTKVGGAYRINFNMEILNKDSIGAKKIIKMKIECPAVRLSQTIDLNKKYIELDKLIGDSIKNKNIEDLKFCLHVELENSIGNEGNNSFSEDVQVKKK